MNISVIIPVYNDLPHLKTTVSTLLSALSRVDHVASEIVVVDDGSTLPISSHDLENLKQTDPISIVHQGNSGRFMARYKGVSKANLENRLLIGARVTISKDSLSHIVSQST